MGRPIFRRVLSISKQSNTLLNVTSSSSSLRVYICAANGEKFDFVIDDIYRQKSNITSLILGQFPFVEKQNYLSLLWDIFCF